MMQEIYMAYNKSEEEYKDRIRRLERLIAAHERTIRELDHKHKGWVTAVLTPIAKRIAAELGGLQWEIYGQFGLSAETSVYFFVGDGHDICKDETYGLTVTPEFREDGFYLAYDTGERTNDYEVNSIGWLNNFHHVRKPLPDSIEEIMGVLSHHVKREER